MIINIRIKTIWQIILALAIVLCFVENSDVAVLITFIAVSIGLFFIDLWFNYTGFYVKSEKFKTLHAWNLISNIGQIFFWSYLIFFVFVADGKSLVLWSILVDAFIATTFLNYKFSRLYYV